jgi:hypothetical protein
MFPLERESLKMQQERGDNYISILEDGNRTPFIKTASDSLKSRENGYKCKVVNPA